MMTRFRGEGGIAGLVIISAGFLFPVLLATNYTLNYFYGHGAAGCDAGWFAWLAAGSVNGQLTNPPAIGGSFFATHMSPIFLFLALVHRVLPINLPAPVFFSLSEGVWYGLLGAALAWCLRKNSITGLLAAGLFIGCAENGVVLATLGFPHFEIAIPALLSWVLALRLAPPRWDAAWLWLVPLLVMFTIREDAGFHAAGIIGCIAFWRARQRGWRAAIFDFAVALACAAVSASDFVLQKALFPNGGTGLTSIYLGSPPFSQLTEPFLRTRLYGLFIHRNYIWVPLLLVAVVAAAARDLRLALGSFATLPWLMISFIAVSEEAGQLVSYYGFPMMIGLLWPLFAACPGLGADRKTSRGYLYLQAVMAILSIALFVLFGSYNHDARPWRGFGFQWAARIGPMEAGMDRLLSQRKNYGRLMVDNAVASLRMGAFSGQEWNYAMEFPISYQKATDTLVYQPNSWDQASDKQIIAAANLNYEAPLSGTPFVIRSRLPVILRQH